MFLTVLVFALVSGSSVFADSSGESSVNVGGHVKLKLYDGVNTISRNNGVQSEINRSYGIAFTEINLYISAKLNDLVGLEVDPRFSASTGASPKLGVTTTAIAGSKYAFNGFGHGRAVVQFNLPYDISAEVGQIHPVFTVEYGKEFFWEELMNGTKFSCNDNAGSLHDQGIEFLKTFNIDDISIPVYLYLLNGGTVNDGTDANNQPGAMVHIEPSWGPFTVLASAYGAKTDAAELKAWMKYAAGLLVNWEGIKFAAEYTSSKKEHGISTGRDAKTEGYYARASYKVLPWLKLFAHHESVLDNFYGSSGAKTTRYITNILGFNIFTSDSSMIQFQLDMADWRTSDSAATLVYTRPYLGMRLTF